MTGAGTARGAGTPRVALVTGGSRGIGLATARLLQESGDRVAITHRSTAVDRAQLAGGAGTHDLYPVSMDVCDAASVDRGFSQVEEALGPVEILVAAAGITRDTLLLRMSESAWSEVIETNLGGVYRTVKRALPAMVRAHFGRVVIISSVAGWLGSPGQANYAAAKAALGGFARSLAREVASRQVTVNVVVPGLIDTDMSAAVPERRREELVSATPIGRMGTPEEVAAAVGYLASPHAGYVTGALLPVDGGVSMGL